MLWNESLETGNEIVDSQHREVFRLVQEVLDADVFGNQTEKIESAMSFLSAYAVRHFASEEALMLESQYPGYETHRALHDGFIKDVVAFVTRFKSEGDTVMVSDTINNFVVTWLQEHIMVSDKEMAEYYKEWEASQA